MRFLADENIPAPSVRELRAGGYDVSTVAPELRSAPDEAVLAVARTQQRMVLTFDRDFGELIFRRGTRGGLGVVLFRVVPRTPTEPADLLLSLLKQPGVNLAGQFVVIDREKVRRRLLPTARSRGEDPPT